MENLKFSILLVLVIMIPLASSSMPPSFPSRFHGKIIDISGNPVPNLAVIASWTESKGVKKAVTMTNLAGDYYFNGEIVTFEDNLVTFSYLEKSVSVQASPGSAVEVPTLAVSPKEAIIEGQNATFFDKVAMFFEGIFDFSQNKEIKNEENFITNNTESEAGGSLDNNSESAKTGSGGNGTATGNSAGGTEGGDGSGSSGSTPAGELKEDTSGSNRSYSGINISYSNKKGVYSGQGFDNLGSEKTNINYYFIFGAIAIIALSVFIIYKYLYRKSFDSDEKDLPIGVLSGKAKNVMNKPAKLFMNKKYKTLSENHKLVDALEIFVEESAPLIPILRGKFVFGAITKKNLLNNLNSEYSFFEKTSISDYVIDKKNLYCEENTSLEKVLEILNKNNLEAVIVVDSEGKFRGVIDYFDILKVLNYFNSRIILENPPIFLEIMNRNIVLEDSKSDLEELRSKLIQKDMNFAILADEGKPEGIVTLKDLVISIHNDGNLKRTKAKNILSPKIYTLNPGSMLSESFQKLIDRRYNQVILKVDDKIVGYADISDIAERFYLSLTKI